MLYKQFFKYYHIITGKVGDEYVSENGKFQNG